MLHHGVAVGHTDAVGLYVSSVPFSKAVVMLFLSPNVPLSIAAVSAALMLSIAALRNLRASVKSCKQ
jgi:hypothetical protein